MPVTPNMSGNMFIAIIYFPVDDNINFKINQSVLMKPFHYLF